MPITPLRRFRIPLLWAAFALAAVAMAVAVHQLYSTARREIADQAARALEEQRDRTITGIESRLDAVRRTTIEELAGFHVDGLSRALRQWDDANALIVGTFLWEPDRGYHRDSRLPATGPSPSDLEALWQHFRAWRAQNPSAMTADATIVVGFRTLAFRTIDNPGFAPASLGYQAENLDMLAFAGRTVDPWAGWAAGVDPVGAPWILWYQAGPDAPVRGCLVDMAPVVEELRRDLGDTRLARLDLAPMAATPESSLEGLPASPVAALPGYGVVATPGEVFARKQSDIRLTALTVASLLGLFLVGGAFLALYSRREMRDAERKSTFVSQVSHELRTPLTSIRMFADMLAQPTVPEEKRLRYAGTISRESQRLASLIERLLAFNRIERRLHRVAIEPVDVAALVRDTIVDMDATLRAAGLQPEFASPASPVQAETDSSSLKQALLNLMENAAKYAGSGGVLALSIAQDREWIRLRVADRGPGIPRSIRSRLFEPFVQGGQTLTDKSPGVGLGLSIARGMLRLAGGDLVLLDSAVGAAFEIRLPVKGAAGG